MTKLFKAFKFVLVFSLLTGPTFVSAQYYQNYQTNYSSTDRATQIAQIQAQINSLLQQILALQNSSSYSTYNTNGSVLGATYPYNYSTTYPSNYSTYPYSSQNQYQYPYNQYQSSSYQYPYNQYGQYSQYTYQPQYQYQNQYQNQYQYTNITPTVNLTANAMTVPRGGPVTLSWTSNYSTTCSGAGATWTGVKGMGGSEYISHIDTPTTFILTCTNSYSNLSASASVTVNVY